MRYGNRSYTGDIGSHNIAVAVRMVRQRTQAPRRDRQAENRDRVAES